MLHVIINALAPVLFIMLLGWLAGHFKLVNNQHVPLLNIFSLDFALPIALFSATVQTPWAGIVQELPLIIVLTVSMWIGYASMVWICSRGFKRSPQDSAILATTAAIPNYAALGLPILGSLFHGSTLVPLQVAIGVACATILVAPLCLMQLDAAQAAATGQPVRPMLLMLPTLMLRCLKRPIVAGPLLGIILSGLGLHLPELVFSAIKPLALASAGATLFLTGLIPSERIMRINWLVFIGFLLQNLVLPFITWGLVLLMGLHGEIARASIILSSLSSGFFGVVFANRFAMRCDDAEDTMLITSILCVVTVPLFILLTAGMT